MGDGDGPGCSSADSAGSRPDKGQNGPTDLQRSVSNMTALAVGPSDEGTDKVLGACKQMKVKAHLFKPSGPSVLCLEICMVIYMIICLMNSLVICLNAC